MRKSTCPDRGSAGTSERLTIGIVAQNGQPHLTRCLESVKDLPDFGVRLEFILVDSASTDGTLEEMLAFAGPRNDTRVMQMRGKVNLAATRNVILKHAGPGSVFLVDGDIVIDPDFIVQALNEISSGAADAVYGKLPEIWHTADHEPYDTLADRYKVTRRHYTPTFMGIVLLGPKIIEGRHLYDEQMRRFEDFEFSTRLNDEFRILALPIVMGTHYTIQYHSAGRVQEFYQGAYQRPAGQFIRNNILQPQRLWRARKGYAGNLLGIVEQIALVVSAFFGPLVFGLVALAVAADVFRFYARGRVHSFVPIRIVGGWQVVAGFIAPERQNLNYEVSEAYPGEQGLAEVTKSLSQNVSKE